jgi:hypothetical protein
MRFALSSALFLVLVSSDVVAACGPPELASNMQIPKTFIFEQGWAIPGLVGSSVIRRYQDESGSDVTLYKPTQDAFVDLQGFELSADGKSLRFVPGYGQWVTSITEYRVKGRIYAYSVETVSPGKADPPMWRHIRARTAKTKGVIAGVLGCGWTTLRYFDSEGNGSFESFQYVGFGGPYSNSTHCPTVPEWALRLLPNRAAAERCSNEERKMLKLPPSLGKLFNEPPTIPVLASETKK